MLVAHHLLGQHPKAQCGCGSCQWRGALGLCLMRLCRRHWVRKHKRRQALQLRLPLKEGEVFAGCQLFVKKSGSMQSQTL